MVSTDDAATYRISIYILSGTHNVAYWFRARRRWRRFRRFRRWIVVSRFRRVVSDYPRGCSSHSPMLQMEISIINRVKTTVRRLAWIGSTEQVSEKMEDRPLVVGKVTLRITIEIKPSVSPSNKSRTRSDFIWTTSTASLSLIIHMYNERRNSVGLRERTRVRPPRRAATRSGSIACLYMYRGEIHVFRHRSSDSRDLWARKKCFFPCSHAFPILSRTYKV